MSSFWADACNFARNRDLQTQLLVLNVFCGSAIAALCFSAVVSGIMLFRYKRISKDGRLRVWPLYGWFCGLMFVSSCTGIITSLAWMQYATHYFAATEAQDSPSNDDKSRTSHLMSLANRWRAVFRVMYSIEFPCMCAVKLMVFERMLDFGNSQLGGLSKRVVAASRIGIAAVVLANATSLACSCAAAFYYFQSADSFSAVSVFYARNMSDQVQLYEAQGTLALSRAASIESAVQFTEGAQLLLIVVTLAVVAVTCARRIKSLLEMIAGQQASGVVEAGRHVRRQIAVTAVTVLVSFVLRSVLVIMFAVSNSLQDSSKPCAKSQEGFCSACYNMYTHMQRWIIRTPEFRLIIVLISSPLAMIVCLWGMTSKRMLSQMDSSGSALAQKHLLPPTEMKPAHL